MLGGTSAAIFVSPNGQPRGDLCIGEAFIPFGCFDGKHTAGRLNHQTDTTEVTAARGLHGEQAEMQSRAGLNGDGHLWSAAIHRRFLCLRDLSERFAAKARKAAMNRRTPKLFVIADHPADEEVEFFLGDSFAECRHRVVRAVELFVAGTAQELTQPAITAIAGERWTGSDFAEQLVFANRLQRVTVDAL